MTFSEQEKGKYLSKFRVLPEGRKGRTKEQSLAAELWRHFDKTISFAVAMSLIKRYGYQWIFECYQSVLKVEHPSNPVALFFWKVKQAKVEFKELQETKS